LFREVEIDGAAQRLGNRFTLLFVDVCAAAAGSPPHLVGWKKWYKAAFLWLFPSNGLAITLRESPFTALIALFDLSTKGLEFKRGATLSDGNQMADKTTPAPNQIAGYFESHKEGPGITKWRHYFDIYHRHFSRFVGREVHVLEIGIYSGGSLLMWKEYFGQKAHIYGVDIDAACRAYEDDMAKVFIGDQADRSFWGEVKKSAPLIDIVIDHGGHLPEQQRVTLEEILPHMRPGGVYLCEDIYGQMNGFAAYVQGLSNKLNEIRAREVESPQEGMRSGPSTFQAACNSIHLYPFVAIIEKCERRVPDFVCPRHGSQWRPWNW
jgi:hypothetical protein